MKYAALGYRYISSDARCNIGDNFQTFAVKQALEKIGISAKRVSLVNRDDLSVKSKRRQEPGILVVQGWLSDFPGYKIFPIRGNGLYPLYFGFHFSSHRREMRHERLIASVKKFEPVGCRDRSTRNFFRVRGIQSYLTGCLTMTFDKRTREPAQTKTFLVDVPESVEAYIPKVHMEHAESTTQVIPRPGGGRPMTETEAQEIDKIAWERLQQYKNEATLIITTKIHAAMPCAAMGIPVIFLSNFKDKVELDRIALVQEILPIYLSDKLDEVNWFPPSPTFETLKQDILRLFYYRLQVIEGQLGFKTQRLSQQAFDNARNKLEQACAEDAVV